MTLIDKYSKLNISKQRRYQLRRNAEGKCTICGSKRKHYAYFCDDCYKIRAARLKKTLERRNVLNLGDVKQ